MRKVPDLKDRNVTVAMTSSVFDSLEAACRERGLKKGAYVRQLIEEAVTKKECE
jgi:hypothetical protein